MAGDKWKRIRRWITRILLFILLLPIGILFFVRITGILEMRKPDAEILRFLSDRQIRGTMDTLMFHDRPIVSLTTTNGITKKDAILFVHGSPGSMDACLEYVVDSSLLARADLITFDRPGFGHSGFGRSMPSLTMQSETVHALMDHLGYARYWLVGHSYGGPIIVEVAMRFPKKVAGICMVAGSVSPELEPKARWRKWIDLPVVRQILPISMRVSNEELMPLRQDLVMIEDDWDKITVPVSLVHGTKDVLVPFENVAYVQEKLTDQVPILLKIFEGKSHFIFWTDRPAIVQEILKLMDTTKE